MVSITSDSLFNAAAAVIATIAALMFILSLQYPYSPVSQIGLVCAFLAGLLYLAHRTPDGQVTLLVYGVMITTLVALFIEVANTFQAGTLTVIVGLLALAGLLYSLPNLDDDNQFLTQQNAKRIFIVVTVLAIGVTTADIGTGGIEYTLQTNDAVTYTDEHNEMQLGGVQAANPSPFPERVETPRYSVCAAGNWSAYYMSHDDPERPERVHVDAYVQNGYNEYVFGASEKTYPVTVNINGANLTGTTFSIEQTDTCPDTTTGEPYIAVFEESGSNTYRYAV